MPASAPGARLPACRVSELRVLHLLEDLCDGMDEYEVARDAAGERWARSGAQGTGQGCRGASMLRHRLCCCALLASHFVPSCRAPLLSMPPVARFLHPPDSLADDLDRKLNIKQRKEQRRELSNFCHDVIEK